MTGFGDLNLKMPSILAISIFMSILNFMLSWVENEKSFITLAPGLLTMRFRVIVQVVYSRRHNVWHILHKNLEMKL